MQTLSKHFLCHIMSPCSSLMTAWDLSVSTYRANAVVSFSYTLIMFREKINCSLIGQKLGSYFNREKYNLDFRGGLYFNTACHLTSPLCIQQLSDEGELWGEFFEQIHVRIPEDHGHIWSLSHWKFDSFTMSIASSLLPRKHT